MLLEPVDILPQESNLGILNKMARCIFKQPDGKYAEYSTIVDSFVTLDATKEELIQIARQEAADEAEERLNMVLERVDNSKNNSSWPTLTWEEAVKRHNNHSEQKIKLIKEKI